MINTKIKFILMTIIITAVSLNGFAGVPVGSSDLLYTDFDDKVPATLLGEGGAELGEPVDTSILTAKVVEDAPGENYIVVTYDPPLSNAAKLQWEFVGGAEITEGLVTFSFQFTPSALDLYNISVREQGGSSRNFLSITYTTSGNIKPEDSSGVISVINDTYTAGTVQNVQITFNMDAGTSELIINGNPLFTGRSHGITDRGIGRLSTGYESSSNNSHFFLDNLSVVGPVELPLLLDVNFEDKVLGQSLGTGGAVMNEPASIANAIMTEIIEPDLGNQALLLENTITGSASSMRWEFVDNTEVREGIVAIETDVYFDQLDMYQFSVRQAVGASQSFTNLVFTYLGTIDVSDKNGYVGSSSTTYQAGQIYRLRITFDIDEGTYTALLDDDIIIANRHHGVNKSIGIGSYIMGFMSNATANASFVVDDIQIGVSEPTFDLIFRNYFE